MVKIGFFVEEPQNVEMIYVVIIARYENKWIFVRHKERDTYEIPGGHIEQGESYVDAAKRELYEETGASDFVLEPITFYTVTGEKRSAGGYLFFADVKSLSPLPDFEIEERIFSNELPEKLTYPHIQPFLFDFAKKRLGQN
ncbi:MAG TPA: NUDIX domain-containing protein [Eubacteriales bacterium]|nr:NUDIX domain-containing protein [Eubacteriales bacterium]